MHRTFHGVAKFSEKYHQRPFFEEVKNIHPEDQYLALDITLPYLVSCFQTRDFPTYFNIEQLCAWRFTDYNSETIIQSQHF